MDILSLMLNTDKLEIQSEVIANLEKEDFGSLWGQIVFQAMEDVLATTYSIDKVLVANKIIENGILPPDGTRDKVDMFLLSVENRYVKDSANYEGYIKILHDLRQRREINQKITDLQKDVIDVGSNMDEIMERVRSISFKITKHDDFIITPEKIAEIREKEILERLDRDKGVMTGFPTLDSRLTHFIYPGLVSVIGARPSIGKTRFKQNLVRNVCEANPDLGVLMFCLEQDAQAELDRLTAIANGIPLREIKHLYMWKKEDPRITQIIKFGEHIGKEWNLTFVNKRTMLLAEAINIMNMLKEKHNIKWVIFDLFDRLVDINASEKKAERLREKLAELAEWARLLDVHVTLVAQVGRRAEMRKDKRPMLSDFVSSGAYEEYADLVFLLYRGDAYNTDDPATFEVQIAKQREGSVGTVQFDRNEATLELIDRGEVDMSGVNDILGGGDIL